MKGFNVSEISYRELDAAVADDLDQYERLIIPGMEDDDVHLRYEFENRLLDGRLRAWWADYGSETVGWCALAPTHRKYFPGAAHLYGSWVRNDFRRRGIARDMWRMRLELTPPDVPVTVSVQPGKSASERLVKTFGFREVSIVDPWVNYVKERA